MDHPRTFAGFLSDIEMMIDILKSKDPGSIDTWELASYYERLKKAAAVSAAAMDEHQEYEFYELLETHPRLKSAYFAATYQSLYDSCSRAIQEYADLAAERALTKSELEAKANAEAAMEAVRAALDEALDFS